MIPSKVNVDYQARVDQGSTTKNLYTIITTSFSNTIESKMVNYLPFSFYKNLMPHLLKELNTFKEENMTFCKN